MTSRTVSSAETTRIAAFMSISISLVLMWERRFSDGDDSAGLMTRQLLAEGAWSKCDGVSRFEFARIMDEREEPALFGLIGSPKARIRKETNLFQSVFEAEVIVWSIDSAGFWDSDRNGIETAKL